MPRVFVLSWFLLASCARAYGATTSSGDALGVEGNVAMNDASADATAETRVDAAAAAPGPRSPVLREATLHSPMPGGYLGGWDGDTGLDIAGNRLDVFAIAAGTLDYSEWGHTLWTRGRDTAFSVRLALDEPIPWGAQRITHVYYTHMSKLETQQREGSPSRKHVEAGERIGVSGIGNGVPHLHLGLLLDGQVEQDSWTFILREADVRKVFGNYKNGALLPAIRGSK